MGYRFACAGCGHEINVRFLDIGEEAACRACGTRALVPESATVADDAGVAAAQAAEASVPSFGINRTGDDAQASGSGDEGYVSPLRDRRRPLDSVSSIAGDVRSWSLWLFGWGAVSILMSGGFGAAFALVLVLMGVWALLFQHPAMYVVFGVVLVSAGLGNIFGPSTSGWSAFGLIQLIMAVNILRRYLRARKVWTAEQTEGGINEATRSTAQSKAEAWFPWIGLGLAGLTGVLLLSFAVLFSVAMAAQADESKLGVVNFEFLLAHELSVLAVAVCAASLLSKFSPRAPAIVGLVLGGIFLIGPFVLFALVTP